MIHFEIMLIRLYKESLSTYNHLLLLIHNEQILYDFIICGNDIQLCIINLIDYNARLFYGTFICSDKILFSSIEIFFNFYKFRAPFLFRANKKWSITILHTPSSFSFLISPQNACDYFMERNKLINAS